MKPNFSNHTFHLSVSIGICAYNEESNIGLLLENLLIQPLDNGFLNEIIVVASGCTDKTEEIVRNYSASHQKVKLITERVREGKTSAINIILRKTQADILVLVMADTLPARGSINKLLQRFYNESVGAVAARPVPLNDPSKLWGFVSHLIWDLHHEISLRASVKLSGELYAIRPRLVKMIPPNAPWDESYFELVIRRQGFKIVYAKESIVHMRGPENLSDLLKQRRRIQVGYLQFKKYGYMTPTASVFKIIPALTRAVNFTNIKELTWTTLAMFLEGFAHLLAHYDFLKKKNPHKWDRIASTKVVSKVGKG